MATKPNEKRSMGVGALLSRHEGPSHELSADAARAYFRALNAALDERRTETLRRMMPSLTRTAERARFRPTEPQQELARKLAPIGKTRHPLDRTRVLGHAAIHPERAGGQGWIPPAWLAYQRWQFSPPFSSADPFPANTEQIVAVDGTEYNRVDALGDNEQGWLSIGTMGGKLFTPVDWEVLSDFYAGIDVPMPESWGFGDSTSARASVVQLVDLRRYETMTGLTVFASASIRCPAVGDPASELTYCYPGPSTTPDQTGSEWFGAIGIFCSVYLTITLYSSEWEQFKTTVQPFLCLVADSNPPSGPSFLHVSSPYYPNWQPNPENPSPVPWLPPLANPFSISGHLDVPADGVAVATIGVSAEAICVRLGTNDPYGGFVGVELRDQARTKGLFPRYPGGVPPELDLQPQPVRVESIEASIIGSSPWPWR